MTPKYTMQQVEVILTMLLEDLEGLATRVGKLEKRINDILEENG
jgi:hypothetical protein